MSHDRGRHGWLWMWRAGARVPARRFAGRRRRRSGRQTLPGGGAPAPSVIRLAEFCDGVAAETSLALRGRPVLITVLCPAQASIEADAVVLRRILADLFATAASFTPRGDICLSIERTETEVFFELSADGSDDAAYAPSLATTQPLVALLGGRIETERGAGTGLVIRLVLPASGSAPRPA